MVRTCAVFGCPNKNKDGLSVFQFPKDEPRRQQWIDFVLKHRPSWFKNVGVWQPGPYHSLCMAHFERRYIDDSPVVKLRASARRLMDDAVPTIYGSSGGIPPSKKTVAALARTELEKTLQRVPQLQGPPDILVPIRELNSLLTCGICKGYIVGATTLTECLHSFCRSCLVRYAHINLHCPTCNILMHPSNPFQNMKPDSIIQDIVYKILPNVEAEEKKREEAFYVSRGIPYPLVRESPPKPPPVEDKRVDEVKSTEKPKGFRNWVSVILEYAGTSPGCGSYRTLTKRYVRIPQTTTIGHMQNFLCRKLTVHKHNQVLLFVDTYLLHHTLTMHDVWTMFFEHEEDSEFISLHYGIVQNKDYFKDANYEVSPDADDDYEDGDDDDAVEDEDDEDYTMDTS